MDIVTSNLDQIVAALGAAILITLGRSPLIPKVRNNKWLMWVAFAVSALAGLMLGYALAGLMSWIVGFTGAGAVLGSLGGIIAVALGWFAIKKLVAMIRDLGDGIPDEAARSAALWVPTLAPAGWAAAWGIVSNPNGIGTGLVAAIMAGITIGFVRSIVKEALASKKHQTAWKWFAAAVCLLAGLVMVPVLLYLDGWVAGTFPEYVTYVRVLLGVVGFALAIAALHDISDKVPDGFVRTFLQIGLPVLIAFGTVGYALITDSASNGVEVLQGTFK